MNNHRLFIVLLLATVTVCFGQNQNTKNKEIQSDTIKPKATQLLVIPIAIYSPETGFAFGGGGQLFFNTKGTTTKELTSSMSANAIYTLKKQMTLSVSSQMYFNDENYFLDTSLMYKVFPNLFWGLGPDTQESEEEYYNQTEFSLSAAFIKRLTSNVNFGFEFNFADYKMTEVTEGGILDSGTVSGATGAKVVGLGFVLNLDSRDNKFSPLGGKFLQFKTSFASRVLGSTHTFNTYHLDLRKYIRLKKNNVVALQLYSQLTFGDSPFQAKAHFGGGNVARGFYGGRYIEDNMYVAQIEYRLPIFKRWELAVFALSGNVAGKDQGLFNAFKTSFGLGPRFFLFKNNRMLLRLDIGMNNEGESGIYFGINEAF